jgi:hypothetical protein
MDALTHEQLRDDAFTCRLLGHAWYIASAASLGNVGRGLSWMVVKCERCTSERRDIVNLRSGEVERRNYAYAKGYQIDEKVVRSQLRTEWARRQQAKQQAKNSRRLARVK